MVFKRRDSLPILQRVQEFFYPRKGWRRAIEYIGHRIRRLPDTPHKIAIGFACGVFASFTPLFGFHFVFAAACAFVFRGNIAAALLGTFFGNPITIPVIAAASVNFGRRLLGVGHLRSMEGMPPEGMHHAWTGLWQTIKGWFGYGPGMSENLSEFFNNIFLPYLVGGIFPGLVVSVAAYFLARPLIAAYQTRRKGRLLARAKQRIAAKKTREAQRVRAGSARP
ncbi:MAG: DUF2062 domain-containing protein [Paracoccaceae bacterium]